MSIILCQCKNDGLIDKQVIEAAHESLRAAGEPLFIVDDLCALAARQDSVFKQWTQQGRLIVAACFERAVRALFTHAGVEGIMEGTFINLRSIQTPEDIKTALRTVAAGEHSGRPSALCATESEWAPWFPVIDYSRCRNCKQCLNFCLFGVYGLAGQTVRVVRPQKCKTGCPACARVCPYAAIIFPKYGKGPINGDAVDEAQWKQACAASAESLKHRLSGGVYQFLKNRSHKEEPNPASLEELEKLKAQFDIPNHVFDSSPEPPQ